MNVLINPSKGSKKIIRSFDESEAKSINKKGWSFSYVYNFSEIRDVFLALISIPYISLNDFYKYCGSISLPYVRTPWTKRRVLEYINALLNFDLIDENYFPKSNPFTSSIGQNLTEKDLLVFKKIYFEYFRFKEISTWFFDLQQSGSYTLLDELNSNDITAKSRTLFSYSENSRFTDTFFYDLNSQPEFFQINQVTSEDLMRFWDVFVKWGTTLQVIEKFSLNSFGIKTSTGRSLACTYFVKPIGEFNLLDFLKVHFSTTYIYIPDLVLKIAIEERAPIEEIKTLLIEQYVRNKDVLSLERTSEIFISKNEIKNEKRVFFPKYRDAFISHIIVRR